MRTVAEELAAYGAGLDDKPRLIALNKIDLADPELVEGFAAELRTAGADRVYPVSGATGEGLDALLDAVIGYLPTVARTESSAATEEDAEAKPWSPV